MANVVNRATAQPLFSVNTPDYPSQDWLINPPGLETLISGNVPPYYWKVSGEDVVEMSPGEKATVDAALLPGLKAQRIEQIAQQTRSFVVAQGYDDTAKHYLTALLADAYGTSKTSRAAYITEALDWINAVQVAYGTAKAACEAAADKTALDAVVLDLSPFESTNPDVTPEGALAIPV